MALALVTGSSGLIGSETVRYFHEKGFDVAGIDNNLRAYFFGEDGSVAWKAKQLTNELKGFSHFDTDIRNQDEIFKLFSKYGKSIDVIVHTAAQPSHDWAAKEPFTDFSVNAQGTLVLLEAARTHCPESTFIFTSTNKVYGDLPNDLPLRELDTRWEPDTSHQYFDRGIDESMSIDGSRHSLFGASKVAADILVQEYGRYFGMKTGIFRGGCLTGPAHSGAELHGFLSWLVKCAVREKPYTIFGYKGKQVRDNIHSRDLVEAFWQFNLNPGVAAVYNIGGSRHSHCSVLEAIDLIDDICGKKLNYKVSDQARSGDHIWWVSDVSKFKADYPEWTYQYDLRKILEEIIDAVRDEK